MGISKEELFTCIRNRWKKHPVLIIFLVFMTISIIGFAIQSTLSEGYYVSRMLSQDKTDTFMDYFNSVQNAQSNPYTDKHVIYPPLCVVFYMIVGFYVINPLGLESVSSRQIADSILGQWSYLLITVFTMIAMAYLLNRLLQKKEVPYRRYIIFLILCCYPLVYALQRGNNIVMVIDFLLFFLIYYDSPNKILRILSFVSLGFAAGFKLWPAIFGLFVLKRGDIRETLLCLAIGAVLVFAPIVFTDGTVGILIDNIVNYSSTTSSKTTSIANLSNLVHWLCEQNGISQDVADTASTIVQLTTALIASAIILFSNGKMWKLVTVAACMMVLSFGVPTTYISIYLILGICFILSERKLRIIEAAGVLCICWVICLPFYPFPGREELVTIKTVGSIIIYLLLLTDGLWAIVNRLKHRNDRSEKPPDTSSA